MKKFYFVITIEENKKYFSYMLPATSSDNLISKLKINNIIAADIHETKKRAAEIVNHRNACYKANNEFLFDDAPAF